MCNHAKPETPPHAWGRPVKLTTGFTYTRNTPTCVGKTSPHPARQNLNKKHPPMRGEDQVILIQLIKKLETPPHAWGRPDEDGRIGKVPGNTPTCVGKTEDKKRAVHSPKKHPHMRGEDMPLVSLQRLPKETPPHAWGRLLAVDRALKCLRNTPTCVGKTTGLTLPLNKNWKHPHMRGEDPERSLNFFLHTWY